MSAIRRVTTLTAAALIAAASFTGGTAALASAASASQARPDILPFGAEDWGYGPTAPTAQRAATAQLRADYTNCNTPGLVWDVQVSAGEWEAEVAATCTGSN